MFRLNKVHLSLAPGIGPLLLLSKTNFARKKYLGAEATTQFFPYLTMLPQWSQRSYLLITPYRCSGYNGVIPLLCNIEQRTLES